MKQILILIVTVFATLPLRAQYEYTLQQCLEEGLLNNYSLRISRNEEQISKNNATLGNAGYLTIRSVSRATKNKSAKTMPL